MPPGLSPRHCSPARQAPTSSSSCATTPDERNAAWAAGRIARFAADRKSGAEQKPFFLGVGFIRPHTPLHVPKKYFDLFPLTSLEMPAIKPGDAVDNTFPGFLYTLQTTLTLQPNDWADAGSMAATESSVVFPFTPPAWESQRFFRVGRTEGPSQGTPQGPLIAE